MTFRALVLISVNEDGLMEGADTYTSGPASVVTLTPAELPQEYLTIARPAG
jgi:hypothetical protein